jgi:hypothetical protein
MRAEMNEQAIAWRVLYRYETDQLGPWYPGEVVELPESIAMWILSDSPGALERLDEQLPAIEVSTADLQSPPSDRMVRSSDTPPLRRSRRRLDRVGDPGDQGAMTTATFKAVREKD